MNKKVARILKYPLSLIMSAVFCCHPVYAALLDTRGTENASAKTINSMRDADNIYVASNNSVQQIFFVIGGALNKPFIVSSEAAKKRVSGNFDLSKPKALLTSLTSRLGLLWYDDGSSVYVYDSSEIQSSVIRLAYAPFARLVTYLEATGLYDTRFPVRSDGQSGSFYASGPPVYVELITAAAKYIDAIYARPGTGESTIRVIKLKNTFVKDRTFTQRDAPITVPGVATVLNQLLNTSHSDRSSHSALAGANITLDSDTRDAMESVFSSHKGRSLSFGARPAAGRSGDPVVSGQQPLNIVGYPDTNSLLIQGSERQVGMVEDLVSAIDIPKQQIQLSLWIIDISKDDINELGVRWQGVGSIADQGITFNTSSLTPANSIHFLADVSALAQKGSAQVVSRPEILTQDNVPALFDNNSSFYARLIGERTSSLEKITYGTMISVLPRLAPRQQEIEMILNIQDGGLPPNIDGKTSIVDNLPMVNNTQISTEARVPVGYSLLVGGYSRDHDEQRNVGIPLLKDIPYLGRLFGYNHVSHKKMVRLFLIHPRLLVNGETWLGNDDSDPVLGRTVQGNQVTLKTTVSMLRGIMDKN